MTYGCLQSKRTIRIWQNRTAIYNIESDVWKSHDFTLGPFAPAGIVAPCAFCPYVPLLLSLCSPQYHWILFIFGTAIDLRRKMNLIGYGVSIFIFDDHGALLNAMNTLTDWCFGPNRIVALQLTISNGSCSYLNTTIHRSKNMNPVDYGVPMIIF